MRNRLTDFATDRLGSVYIREFVRYWIHRQRLLLSVTAIVVATTLVSALTGNLNQADTILGLSLFYLPMIAGLLSMSGIVADDRGTNLMVIWYQKPGRISAMYLKRYATFQVLVILFALVVALLVGGIAIGSGIFAPGKMLRVAAMMLLVGVLTGSSVFCFSAWGVRRDSAVAFIVIVLTVMFAGAFAFDETATGAFVRSIAFPMDAFGAITGSSAYHGKLPPLLLVLVHIMAWSVGGLVGLWHTERALACGRVGAEE